jgi:hypothetical protein
MYDSDIRLTYGFDKSVNEMIGLDNCPRSDSAHSRKTKQIGFLCRFFFAGENKKDSASVPNPRFGGDLAALRFLS